MDGAFLLSTHRMWRRRSCCKGEVLVRHVKEGAKLKENKNKGKTLESHHLGDDEHDNVFFDAGNVGGEKTKINKKYNAKNILGNVLECEECGASYRRRTERGKVVYRCATRMEKGREDCGESPIVE